MIVDNSINIIKKNHLPPSITKHTQKNHLPPSLTKHTQKKTTTYDVGNPGPGLG